jgi:hypothetical protein
MVMFRPEAMRGNGASELRIRVHYDPDLRPEDVTTLDGTPITTRARTLLDLATCVDDDELEQALANAIRRGLTTYAEIREVMGAIRATRGWRDWGRWSRKQPARETA